MDSVEKPREGRSTGCLGTLSPIVLFLVLLCALLLARAEGLDESLRLGILAVCLITMALTFDGPIREQGVRFFRKRRAFRPSSGARMVKKYEGHLEGYWETGMEGRIIYSLSVEGLDRPFFLKNGQRLTIYAEDGRVLWSGILCFVKRRWWDQHRLPYGIWADEKQAGVSYAQWIAWFAHKPPLKATVEVEEDLKTARH